MRVEFRNAKLRRAFQESRTATREWGEAIARKYIQRLEVLYAATGFDQVQKVRSLRAHPLKHPRKGQWALDLNERWRLIVIPSADGKAITIKEVTKHYGD